jgi:predicted dienelactone hydrolase
MNRRLLPFPGDCARRVLALAGAGLTVGLTACGSPPASRHEDAQPREVVRELVARGYASVEHDAVTTTVHAWSVSGQHVRVVLAQPQRSGRAPLVIYVPGLGESSDAGEKWRAAWSSAGYAVMSVQVLDEDASAWRSELAREGDFKGLGRQRYAGAVMDRRVKALEDVLDEARKRATAGEPAWNRVDWTRMAIAGFDLGAYTAMTVAGEHVPGALDASADSGRLIVRAAIALSPYASVSAGSLESRYRDIRTPVMSVTSDIDGDALGMVEGAAMRGAPFAHMEGPDKFLLSMQGMTHASLSGSAAEKDVSVGSGRARPSPSAADKQGSEDTGQHRRSGGKRAGSGEAAGAARDLSATGEGHAAGDSGLSPSTVQMRMSAAQHVSTAFLDAYVKDDPLARQWLTAEATRWLGPAGELQRK